MSLSEEENRAEWKVVGDKYREQRHQELAAKQAATDAADARRTEEYALLFKEQNLVDVAKACGVQAWPTYQDYLGSRIWRQKRQSVLARAKGLCEVSSCWSPVRDVHHAIYPVTWGTESLEILVALCGHHHNIVHDDDGSYAAKRALLQQHELERTPR